jgi:hypothetical protein
MTKELFKTKMLLTTEGRKPMPMAQLPQQQTLSTTAQNVNVTLGKQTGGGTGKQAGRPPRTIPVMPRKKP